MSIVIVVGAALIGLVVIAVGALFMVERWLDGQRPWYQNNSTKPVTPRRKERQDSQSVGAKLVAGLAASRTVKLAAIVFCLATGAQAYSVDRLADAIWMAEGVNSRHTYGVMQQFSNTTPRQACINTIRHAMDDWNGRGCFVAFLAGRYCPPSVDPVGHRRWVRNVKSILALVG